MYRALSSKEAAALGITLNGKAEVSRLIQALGDTDSKLRVIARELLVEMGPKVISEVAKVLDGKNDTAKYEAVKCLADIAHPSTAKALASMLDFKEGDIRWIAADGLVELGNAGIEPLLRKLTTDPDSANLRRAVLHALVRLSRRSDLIVELTPVIEALNGPSPASTAPVAAERLLIEILTRRPARWYRAVQPNHIQVNTTNEGS